MDQSADFATERREGNGRYNCCRQCIPRKYGVGPEIITSLVVDIGMHDQLCFDRVYVEGYCHQSMHYIVHYAESAHCSSHSST